MDKIKEIVDITNFSLNPLEDENDDLIVFGYDNQPMILLDLIPKDIKKLIQEIKNKRKSSLDKWIEKILNPSGLWEKIDAFLTHASELIHDKEVR